MSDNSILAATITLSTCIMLTFANCSYNKPNAVEVDPVARVYQKQAQIAAKRIVINEGYSCDSVSFFIMKTDGKTQRISCNDNRYTYELYDHGGIILIRVIE